VLIPGEPDRDQLYDALSSAEKRLGRPVEATIRDPAWLETGTGAFHDAVTSRPMLRLGHPACHGSPYGALKGMPQQQPQPQRLAERVLATKRRSSGFI
jgi:hypothetical protein